ncbi:hypothetical protein EK21DRAFT_102004 [Setomelanomma holmii]|uniref:Zn(2)-C6 fungal-type domain-containing protein n=1 Tax=Setomelanomma holmii TaxID=210430 RepID=A0A9P4H4V7_9PLEO|nr:hypothetical protein EK21DRAFT_102004 [Setomelanomma holmii]
MDDLEDELDLRYHRRLEPEVYHRCPTHESLDGALRNELEKNASSLIPVEIVTEFVFAAASTITIPVVHQLALKALIQPADHLQSITVDYALCRDIDVRSIIEAIQDADGFKYSERSAQSKEGGDGARLKYVCQDSLQNRDRKNNMKKEKHHDSEESETQPKKRGQVLLPTYGCGGAIHVKFSIERQAINVVYKHNPIHTSPANGESNLPPLAVETVSTPASKPKAANGTKERKRKRSKKDAVEVEDDYRDPDFDMSTYPEAPETAGKKKRKKSAASASPDASRKLGTKKIKCNEVKPTCNQCRRGLWTCQYELPGAKKRSKNGCINCKTRKRKCTEERPSCAYCLRIDDDCEYADYS